MRLGACLNVGYMKIHAITLGIHFKKSFQILMRIVIIKYNLLQYNNLYENFS